MSIFQGFHPTLDYPVYQVSIGIGTSPESVSAGLNIAIIPTLPNPSTNADPGLTDYLTALFAEIKSFGESYDWTTDYGAGTAQQTFSVSKATETETDVTPA